uniref:Uncharacterized protein n=1 Tax=Amphimedon queenslandica TaxID=400682 RepID=A0A1X7VWT4_AMPQE
MQKPSFLSPKMTYEKLLVPYNSLQGRRLVLRLQFIPSGPSLLPMNDASACGKASGLRNWWSALTNHGPLYGYHPNLCKTWLVVKSKYLDSARLLSGTQTLI